MAPILAIVDDETNFRSFVRQVAEPMGWRVEEMANGSELRQALDAGLVPTLVVADVLMPEEDGIELARTLTKYPAITRLQVLTGGPLLFANAIQVVLQDTDIEFLEPCQKPISLRSLRRILATVHPVVSPQEDPSSSGRSGNSS